MSWSNKVWQDYPRIEDIAMYISIDSKQLTPNNSNVHINRLKTANTKQTHKLPIFLDEIPRVSNRSANSSIYKHTIYKIRTFKNDLKQLISGTNIKT